MVADASVLVDCGKAAEYHPVADMDMPGKGRVVGKDAVIAHAAVMRHMGVDHEQVPRADPGDALVLYGAAVHRAVLAYDVVIAYFEEGPLAGILLVLAVLADGGELEDPVPAADFCRSLDYAVGADHGALADFDFLSDVCPRTDSDSGTECRAVLNYRGLVNPCT